MQFYQNTISSLFSSSKVYWLSILCLGIISSLILVSTVAAGVGGAEFIPLTVWFRGLITGNLGRLIAFAALAVGGIIGIARLTGMPMGAAFLIAILLVFGVTIIENIITATV